MVVVVRSYWPQSLYCQMDKTGDCGRTQFLRNMQKCPLFSRFALKWHRIFEFGAVFIAISFYWKEGKSTLSVD